MELTKIMDIFAYYLSEYDVEAFHTLGFYTQASGFETIASLYGKKSSYLRRLRDEYDVVTNSSRKGQRNREPRVRIEETARYLESFSFVELTDIVKALLENVKESEDPSYFKDSCNDISLLSEEEIENILNAKDPSASFSIHTRTNKTRVYKTAIINQLKMLYKGCCQLCGSVPFEQFGTDICEAHHIEYFSESQNNDASNIIIICPNHHRIIHKLNPKFIPEERCFEYPNGKKENIKIDYIR